jgi:hypothetical protein
MPHCCEFCGKEFPTTGGVKRHIASRPECRRRWELMIEEKEAVTPISMENQTVAGPQVDFAYDDVGDSFSPLRRSRSKSSDADEDNPAAPKSRRVTVEDVADEDEDNLIADGRRYFEQCPDAGWTLREGQTGFERYQKYKEGMGEDEWAPFCDEYVPCYVHHLCEMINFSCQGRMGTC